MQTVWNGYATPSMANVVWTPEYTPVSLPTVLNDIPEIATRVQLPETTQGVWLWTETAKVWYALNTDPGPIPAVPIGGTTIPATAFQVGGILIPHTWQFYSLPITSSPLTLHLLSQVPSVAVDVTALLQYVP